MAKTMRKTLAIMFTVVIFVSFFGCGKKDDKEKKPSAGPAFENANALYTELWKTFPEEEKFFAVGGDEENRVENGPGSYDIQKYPEDYVYITLVNEDLMKLIENDASTMQFMMNSNSFSSSCVKLKKTEDAAAFSKEYKDAVLGNQWMCGFPDRVMVIGIDDYLFAAYGIDDFMEPFKRNVLAFSNDAEILIDEPVIGF